MKKLVLSAAICLLTCIGAKAQDEVSIEVNEPKIEAIEAQEATELNPMMFAYSDAALTTTTAMPEEQQSVVLVNNNEHTGVTPGKVLRNIGIGVTCAGAAMAIGFALAAVHDTNKDSDSLGGAVADGVSATFETMFAIAGGAVAIAGGIMWGVGQHKMNRFKASQQGLGLAYTF